MSRSAYEHPEPSAHLERLSADVVIEREAHRNLKPENVLLEHEFSWEDRVLASSAR